ncbi:MAG TPA: NrfD/PsrC family molybdoenzyme membrane anchor subunit [Chthoniobacterales bacterium]|nr:NrfD/PsrC family molybdoenzyme membrane anchor subunit [Chthoniobacterales bacterium]
MPNEARIDEIREEAWAKGVVTGKAIDVAGGPIPPKVGYYGQPVVRPPVWTWEIPIYFFLGGLGGMSAVIALGATLFHQFEVARTAMWVAGIASVLSPVLLILDLGRPRLFINMLRVFKLQSAMSMGAWILAAFGVCVVPGLVALELQLFHLFDGAIDQILSIGTEILIFGSAIFGVLLATYTGVLIGVTSIPAWFLHHKLLPIHFGTAGLGSAAALLELLGHRIAPLNVIGLLAAAVETVLLIWLTVDKHGAADRALHEHRSGWLIRMGEALMGPIPLVLRFFGVIPLAAISFLIGALVSRFGWLAVGRISGCDPEAVFASQNYSRGR